PARAGHDRGAPVVGCDGSCTLAAGAGSRETGASIPGVLCAERHGYGVLVTEGRRQLLRALTDSGAARGVSEPDAGALGNQGELELYPRRRFRIISDRRHTRRTKRG